MSESVATEHVQRHDGQQVGVQQIDQQQHSQPKTAEPQAGAQQAPQQSQGLEWWENVRDSAPEVLRDAITDEESAQTYIRETSKSFIDTYEERRKMAAEQYEADRRAHGDEVARWLLDEWNKDTHPESGLTLAEAITNQARRAAVIERKRYELEQQQRHAQHMHRTKAVDDLMKRNAGRWHPEVAQEVEKLIRDGDAPLDYAQQYGDRQQEIWGKSMPTKQAGRGGTNYVESVAGSPDYSTGGNEFQELKKAAKAAVDKAAAEAKGAEDADALYDSPVWDRLAKYAGASAG